MSYDLEEKVSEDSDDRFEDYIPENRISTYEEALSEYRRATDSHIEQAKVWGRIDKLFSGIPPFNSQVLKQLNQRHVVNSDFGDARSSLQKAITSYFNIFFKNKFLAEINVVAGPEISDALVKADIQGDAIAASQWSNIITEEWTYNKRVDWGKEFYDFISSHLREMMLYGVHHIYWPSREDPRPKAGTRYAHYNTRDAWTDPKLNDIHIVKHEFSVFELLGFWKSDSTGFWNKDALADVLVNLLQNDSSGEDEYNSTNQVTWIEHAIERLRQKEGLQTDFYNMKVEVASLFVKEFEFEEMREGVSHIIITPHIQTCAPIFFRDRAEKCMSDVLVVATLLPGFDKIRNSKGLGHISYGHLLELTKMKCNFATNLKLSGTTFFRSESSSLGDIRKITVPVSGISILPESVKLEHANTNLAVQNLLAGVNYLEQDLQKNSLFVFNTSSSDESAVGVVQQKAKEFVEMQQNNIAHYMVSTLDVFYSTLLKKELQYYNKKNRGGMLAQKFIKRCLMRGVPKQLFRYENVDDITGLPVWLRINAYKGTGTGSSVGDSLKIQEAYQFGIPQKLKSRGGQYFRELEAAAIFGQESVQKLYPPEDIADDPTYHATLASMVANQLVKGETVQFSPDLDHAVFAAVLLERMQEIADQYMQQPPTGLEERKQQEREYLYQTDLALQGLGNFLGLHLTYLAQDPVQKEVYQGILPLFNRLEGMAQGIHANAAKAKDAQAREAAEQQGGENVAMRKLIFEDERARLEMQMKHVREIYKAKGSFNLDLIKAQNSAKINHIKAMGDVQAKIVKAAGGVKKSREG